MHKTLHKNLFSKCEQIRSFLLISSHSLKNCEQKASTFCGEKLDSLMESLQEYTGPFIPVFDPKYHYTNKIKTCFCQFPADKVNQKTENFLETITEYILLMLQ